MSKYVDIEKILNDRGRATRFPDTSDLYYHETVLQNAPIEDVAPVVHAHWELSAKHYFNDDGNCVVYITGVCTSCKTKWHNEMSIFWGTLSNYDYDNERDWPITNDRIDKCKEDCLKVSKKRILEMSLFCEKCGAKMDGEENNES